MAVIIKEPVTGYIICEINITSTEQLRKLEQDFVVIQSKEKED